MQRTSSGSLLSEEIDNQQHPAEDIAEEHYEENVDPEFAQKHPLQQSWTLWYHNPPQFIQVYTFEYVEDFWSVFNHIKPPTHLETGSAYYILKDGIRPEWEDPKNIHGGEWMFPFLRKKCNVNDWWMNLAMALIGEFFDDGEIITGGCVAVRKSQFRLNIWVGDKSNDEAIVRIGQQFKESLNHGSITGNTKQGDLSILTSHADQFTFDFKTFEDQLQGKKNVLHCIRID
ncbi:eukaryotic translation initiation factor 4E [Naegleria gruberi]|uniref:Eukaryotic translation initiation factor 4E n=1 Tax=Naegleria gruberi TaxID=5762 RepID=D2V0B1_NAEGR|nr:eukaryotic translation initiation factor 4E [Naegleria gruberi]EFC49685.1 eukaryotic translation initiation factor 4E [Naegleria gruberi]|eukprot:XP_002682429.1 eukaryotic translation initiation factor 4E [Naegleria gruberi strain NEG-M]